MKQLQSRLTCGLFCLLLFGITLWNLFTPDTAFSENENRYLQQRPAFSLSGLNNGKYTSAFERYIADQFAGRDTWVGLKTLSELALQKQASGGVYFAREEHLIEMFDRLDEVQFAKNLGYIAYFEKAMEAFDVQVETMLVPTASWVYRDKLPKYAPETDQQALLAQAKEELLRAVDVFPALLEHNHEGIYYRTDHHWTSLGAFYAYNAWREGEGEQPVPIDHYQQQQLSNSFYGTTYSKANLYTVEPDTITAFFPLEPGGYTVEYNGETVTDSIYELSYLEKKDKYSVFLNANQSLAKIETGISNGRKLLLVKDSYANAFAQFLLEDYEEIHVVDLRFFRTSVTDYAWESGVTDVLILYNLKGFSTDVNLYYLTV